MKKSLSIFLWSLVALAGALAYATMALRRGEPLNSATCCWQRSVPRLSEAESLWRIVREAERGSLETARGAAEQRLQGRSEIIP